MTKSASIPVTQKLSVMRSLPYDVIYPKYYKHSNESGTFVVFHAHLTEIFFFLIFYQKSLLEEKVRDFPCSEFVESSN